MEFTVMDTNNPGKNPASDGTVAAITRSPLASVSPLSKHCGQ